MPTNWLIEKAGVSIAVECCSFEAERLFDEVFAGLKCQATVQEADVKLSIDFDGGKWLLIDHSADKKTTYNHSGDLAYMLSDRIVFNVADKTEQAHCLHAAAVASQGKAILIPAKSGSGKSSFTCWMVQAGFDYCTDELILLNNHVSKNKSLRYVYRPIQIKPHGIDAITPLLNNQIKHTGNMVNAITVDMLGGDCCEQQELDAGLFVFPRYDKDAGFEFEKLSPAEAGMNIMSNHVNARNLEGHGFREMMSLVRQVPSYTLTYGGFDKLPNNFADTITQAIK